MRPDYNGREKVNRGRKVKRDEKKETSSHVELEHCDAAMSNTEDSKNMATSTSLKRSKSMKVSTGTMLEQLRDNEKVGDDMEELGALIEGKEEVEEEVEEEVVVVEKVVQQRGLILCRSDSYVILRQGKMMTVGIALI